MRRRRATLPLAVTPTDFRSLQPAHRLLFDVLLPPSILTFDKAVPPAYALAKPAVDAGKTEEGTHERIASRLAVGGAFALCASGLLFSGSAHGEGADETAINQAVDTLRQAALQADRAKLEQVTAAQLSYGHSDGRVETKEQFINGVMTRKQVVKSITFPELRVSVVGNAAVARHIYLSESELDGKATTTRIAPSRYGRSRRGRGNCSRGRDSDYRRKEDRWGGVLPLPTPAVAHHERSSGGRRLGPYSRSGQPSGMMAALSIWSGMPRMAWI